MSETEEKEEVEKEPRPSLVRHSIVMGLIQSYSGRKLDTVREFCEYADGIVDYVLTGEIPKGGEINAEN